MVRNSFISNFRKLPLAFLGSLLLFFIIQASLVNSAAFWRFCYRYSALLYDDALKYTARLHDISSGDNRNKIFVIGSSQTREDIDMDFLNRLYNDKHTIFYNLGTSGSAQPLEVFQMKDDLLSKQPQTIIYISFVGSFYSDYDFSKLKYYFQPDVLPYLFKHLGVRDVASLKNYLIDSLIGKIIISYRYKESLRRSLDMALYNYLILKMNVQPAKYAYSVNKSKLYFQEEIEKAKGEKYQINRQTTLFKEMLVLSARDIVSKGVKFIVIRGPTHPLIKECYPREIDNDFNNFMQSQAGIIGFSYLPEEQMPLFTEEEFIDFTHLNSLGRAKFTRYLGELLLANKP